MENEEEAPIPHATESSRGLQSQQKPGLPPEINLINNFLGPHSEFNFYFRPSPGTTTIKSSLINNK